MNLSVSTSSFGYHMALVSDDGSLYTWGRNNHGQLGLGDRDNRHTPQKVTLPLSLLGGTNATTRIASVTCGHEHTHVILSSGHFLSCGRNFRGQLGFGQVSDDKPLFQLAPGEKVKKIECGLSFSVALTVSSKLLAWGQTGVYGLPRQVTEDEMVLPREITNISEPVLDFASGAYHVIFMTASGLYAIGDNDRGQLGLGHKKTQLTPVRISVNWIPKQISCGFQHSMVLSTDGNVYTCGLNTWGQLGHPGEAFSFQPVTAMNEGPGGPKPKTISAAALHGLVMMDDGSLRSWGWNDDGQLGIGLVKSDQFLPRTVSTDYTKVFRKGEHVYSIGCGYAHSFFLTNYGRLFVWGYGGFGTSGLGIDTNVSKPELLDSWKFALPNNYFWNKIFQWVFLGVYDENSSFYRLPVEIIFAMVGTQS
eukprot:TRINITY_DN3068_c0_g1_i2.p1 TRINITY_DN3068_c0_g1~~TRINITY_DN3068_c0_g1_i2.p1  ORF type:complete len:420 (+),score=38.18 TRINITY_DN3068_c0_g1_i2:31-1290(+)